MIYLICQVDDLDHGLSDQLDDLDHDLSDQLDDLDHDISDLSGLSRS